MFIEDNITHWVLIVHLKCNITVYDLVLNIEFNITIYDLILNTLFKIALRKYWKIITAKELKIKHEILVSIGHINSMSYYFWISHKIPSLHFSSFL